MISRLTNLFGEVKAINNSLQHTFLEVMRLYHQLLQTFLLDVGVYPGQPQLLYVLNEEGGLSQKELAERLHVTPATLTVMLNRMEKSELVRRQQDQQDQRVYRVYITEKGKDIFTIAGEIMTKVHQQMLVGVEEHEKEQLQELLARISDNLLVANSNR